MKRTWLTVMIMVVMFTFVSTVSATTIQLNNPGDANRYYNGGPFNAVLSGSDPGLMGTAFTTFCLERNEYFYNWGTYYNYTISGSAVNGGVGGGSPDPLSAKSAYLYYNFRTDSTFADTVVKKQALQAAFWYLEDESNSTWSLPSDPAQYSANWWAWQYINTADGSFNNNGRVVVLNLYQNGTQLQSQLGLARVPEPTSLLLLGLGLVGIGLLRRKQ